MPVIINDFEIISAPPPTPAEQQEAISVPKQEKPMTIRPEDIERIQQRQQLRRARVWAK
ncbi:hypothetical protein [Nitrosomonas ureae]|uniref:Uncharacterized protein n=1 Tax=Nitrosomonas ureae TaxID=44577 RepID=A0A1H9D143_9PROT|nr:hypothetical protein [Nitrosomonas ureae]SEQ07190.1 hypothetical protein SAMN05421510_101838 [Nitrosomonas ureae]